MPTGISAPAFHQVPSHARLPLLRSATLARKSNRRDGRPVHRPRRWSSRVNIGHGGAPPMTLMTRRRRPGHVLQGPLDCREAEREALRWSHTKPRIDRSLGTDRRRGPRRFEDAGACESSA